MRSIFYFLSSICLLPLVIFGENKEDREIVITGNDAMQFDLKEFQATPGEKITITFKNIGSLPKIAMGHNLVLL